MRIYLAHAMRLTKFDLMENSDDFFSYNYHVPGMKNSSLITFERIDNLWYIKSNGTVNVIENNIIVQSRQINLYECINLKILGCNHYISLYALPSGDEKLFKLAVNDMQVINIGSSPQSNIYYSLPAIAPIHATIKKNQNVYVIQSCEDQKFSVYVNGDRIGSKVLKMGDTIFINGLKIIWMNQFIIINNPGQLVKVIGMQAYIENNNQDIDNITTVSDEEQSLKLYDDEDYFCHSPLIREIVEEQKITIEDPPASFINNNQLPWYLKIGTSVAMLGMSFAMIWNLGVSLSNNAPIIRLVPQIIMVVCMLIGSLIAPKLVDRYTKKMSKKKEAERIQKYTAYLEEKEKELDLKTKKMLRIMNDNYMPPSICKNIAFSTNNRYFWGREINDIDFLKIRFGLGTIDSPISISAHEKKFTLEEDPLITKAMEIRDKYSKISPAPITFSLTEKTIASFIYDGNTISIQEYFNNIMVQLVTLHSAADLKIVIFTNEENSSKWNYAKFLPHCLSEDKSVRYFATNTEEIKEVSTKLEEDFNSRLEKLGVKKSKIDLKDNIVEESTKDKINRDYLDFEPYYLIICDVFKNTNRIPIIDKILENSTKNIGFSFLVLTNSMKNLPSECNTFIEVNDKDGCILNRNISSDNQCVFNVERDNNLDMHNICKALLNIPLMGKEGLQVLPQSLSFLDMYSVSKIEQLNILNRWKTNDPITGLGATIGVYANGEQFKLNLHEKFHGPHGLIAGSTGSGKSEFIITYILSMCINYHPYEVQFVLIDYKGGGLAGAFENRETGVRIPHLAGTITNLDTAEMNRTLVSINSELKRRQRIFNETRDHLGESTIDIYKYQKFYREGLVKEPMAHLFIISDEFAELKAQQPDFMQELISTARIGRSLGVHLILATQKPSGVVNEQIWSNSRFKVCLKVQDRSDSMEMLKKPDAASIKEPGRFYLQVGYDEFFDKGQSGWAGAKYIPSDKVIKKIDDSISFITNTGDVFKSAKDIVKVETNNEELGDQLTNIVKYINKLGQKENIKTNRLWLEAIPEIIFVNNLKKKYDYKRESFFINPIIGEYDNPKEQSQGLLTLNLMENGNTLIIGKQGSGKENLINTILLSSIIDHTPEEVNFYIIDCGTESLKIYNKMPHVGDIATSDEVELVTETFKMLDEEIAYRKDIMADYSGSYSEYINNSGKKLPLIVTIINNYESFTDSFGRMADNITNLYRDGFRYGVVFIITALLPNSIRGKMLQNFNNKLCLQLSDDTAYRSNFSTPRNLIPTKYFGRGLCLQMIDNESFEFQTAYVVEKTGMNNFIREASTQYAAAYTSRAKKVPMVPDIVDYNRFFNDEFKLSAVPLGYSLKSKDKYYYDFMKNSISQIVMDNVTIEKMSFLKSLVKKTSQISNLNVTVIDFVEIINETIDGIQLYNENIDTHLLELNNSVLSNKDDSKINLIYIFGISAYKTDLSADGKVILNNLLTRANTLNNTRFIIVDVASDFKSVQIDPWYYANVDNSTGLWLGANIASQALLNVSSLSFEDKKMKYPFMLVAIDKSQHEFIRFMVDAKEVNIDGK